MTDSDFIQIMATHYATGQVLLYPLTRAGYVWQFEFNKHPVGDIACGTSLAAPDGAGTRGDYRRALRGKVDGDHACRRFRQRRSRTALTRLRRGRRVFSPFTVRPSGRLVMALEWVHDAPRRLAVGSKWPQQSFCGVALLLSTCRQ